MLGVAEYELQRVFARWQFNACSGLARTKMQVSPVLRNRLIWIERFVHVDQQMMVTAVCKIIPRMRNPHIAQAEATPKSSFDHRSILRSDEIQIRIIRGRFPLRKGRRD
jgi:hypothetical protein